MDMDMALKLGVRPSLWKRLLELYADEGNQLILCTGVEARSPEEFADDSHLNPHVFIGEREMQRALFSINGYRYGIQFAISGLLPEAVICIGVMDLTTLNLPSGYNLRADTAESTPSTYMTLSNRDGSNILTGGNYTEFILYTADYLTHDSTS